MCVSCDTLDPVQHISLLSVGKVKTPWIAEGCSVFAERLGHLCKFEQKIIAAGDRTSENEKLSAALEKIHGTIIVLDETGKSMSSSAFASTIGKHRDHGESITFVIGGAYGLDASVKARASTIMALGPMTLPHELCQLLFLEQLYRAHTILAGTGYHH